MIGDVLCGVEMSERDGEDSGKEGVHDVQHNIQNIHLTHCTTYTTLQTLLRTARHCIAPQNPTLCHTPA
jgi:hypothetical protein